MALPQTNNNQWLNQQSDEVKTLDDILRWLKKLNLTLASGVSTAIGDPVVGGTADHVLYIDNSGNLFGDANFTRDSTTKLTNIQAELDTGHNGAFKLTNNLLGAGLTAAAVQSTTGTESAITYTTSQGIHGVEANMIYYDSNSGRLNEIYVEVDGIHLHLDSETSGFVLTDTGGHPHWEWYMRDPGTGVTELTTVHQHDVLTFTNDTGFEFATTGDFIIDIPSAQANGVLRATDADGTAEWTTFDVPAGSDTQVQFNDGGSLGADAGLVYDKTNNVLTVDGIDIFSKTVNSTIIGDGAGGSFTGAENTIIGNAAAANLTTGTNNVGIGTACMENVSTGIGNTIIGSGSGGALESGDFNIAIGDAININGADINNTIVFGKEGKVDHSHTISFSAPEGTTAENQLVIGGSFSSINDGYIGNGILSDTPESFSLNATGGAGEDIAGASLTLAGGKGTGTGTPGVVNIAVSTLEASGTTLQTLVNSAQFDASETAGNTRFLLYDVNAGALQRVKVGANNTGPGGSGRALYIDNV